MLPSIASTELVDIFQPQPVGETVNTHVVTPALEPKPDFDAMKKTIEGTPNTPSRDTTRNATDV